MTLEEKILSVLSYFHIFVLIPLFWRKRTDVMNSHIYSGIVLLFMWSILLFVLKIPFVGVVFGVVLIIASVVFTIWGLVDAISGRDARIPGIEKVSQLLR